ncbi:hypothetical protein GCM10027570_25220 [Streptomonospora sediminis]
MSGYRGRSGRSWKVEHVRLRPGHLRPGDTGDGAAPHRVDLVVDEHGGGYGALRRFADRQQRADALGMLAPGATVLPILFDVVDDPRLPPSIVSSWAAGGSDRVLAQLSEADDLHWLITQDARRWRPSEALRVLAPLGQALDRLATHGYAPIELSPDHVVHRDGRIRLVGLSRHTYLPVEGRFPSATGMSLPTAELLGEDIPAHGAPLGVWRDAQIRALMRLAGWMASGLPPVAFGPVSEQGATAQYLRHSGFCDLPTLRPGTLAEDLLHAAREEEISSAQERIAAASAVVVYDDAAGAPWRQPLEEWLGEHRGSQLSATVTKSAKGWFIAEIDTGERPWSVWVHARETPEGRGQWIDVERTYPVSSPVVVRIDGIEPQPDGRPPKLSGAVVRRGWGGVQPRPRKRQEAVSVNPECVRLALQREHGPGVLAVAAFPRERQSSPLAGLLSGAGWLLVDPASLADTVHALRRCAARPRWFVVGRRGAGLSPALPPGTETVDPAEPLSAPEIDGRSALDLPFLSDPALEEYHSQVLGGAGGQSLRRRTFPAGWALALSPDALQHEQRRKGDGALPGLTQLMELLPEDTELLLRVRDRLNRPGSRKIQAARLAATLDKAVPLLTVTPAQTKLRDELLSVLLHPGNSRLLPTVRTRLLPVIARLAEIFEPTSRIGNTPMPQLLTSREGLERISLLARMAIAVGDENLHRAADYTALLDPRTVHALLDVPAPSLRFLVERIAAGDLSAQLAGLGAGPDADLLARYTPHAWRLLVEGMRDSQEVGSLGLAWALVVDQDPDGIVDPNALKVLAADAGCEPRYAVRALLNVEPRLRPSVLAHPALAAACLRASGDLDIADVLQVFPDADTLIGRLAAPQLRAAAYAGWSREDLDSAFALAEHLGLPPEDVVHSLINAGADDPEIVARVTGVAAAAWLLPRVVAGSPLQDLLDQLVRDEDVLRQWAIGGSRPPLRILADVLGTDPRTLGVSGSMGREMVGRMAAEPALLSIARRLETPRLRLALLELARIHEPGLLSRPHVRVSLPDILSSPRAAQVVRYIGYARLSVPSAVIADELGLHVSEAALLRHVDPLLPGLAQRCRQQLVALGRAHGGAAMYRAAVLEHAQPGTIDVAYRWGVDWLPLLAGPDARTVMAIAARHTPSPPVSAWLLRAGLDGLRVVERHGDAALGLLDSLGPESTPPQDARVLGRLMDLTRSTAGELYRLVTEHGLPVETWPYAADSLDAGRSRRRVLSGLRRRKAARLVRASGAAGEAASAR